MSRRFGHYEHVVRMFGLFVAALALFLITRWLLIPSDFGVYGFYRAGALADNRARTPVHSGEAACLECHTEVVEQRKPQRHATVRCEACHGPLAAHAAAPFEVKSRALDPRGLCLSCHASAPGKVATIPLIVAADHFDEPCAQCHTPHRPRIE